MSVPVTWTGRQRRKVPGARERREMPAIRDVEEEDE